MIAETIFKCQICGLRSSNYDFILSHDLQKTALKPPPFIIGDEIEIIEPSQGDIVYAYVRDIFISPKIDFMHHYHVWSLKIDYMVFVPGGKTNIIPLEMVKDPSGLDNRVWYLDYELKINVIGWPELGKEKYKMIFKEY